MRISSLATHRRKVGLVAADLKHFLRSHAFPLLLPVSFVLLLVLLALMLPNVVGHACEDNLRVSLLVRFRGALAFFLGHASRHSLCHSSIS